MLELGPDEYAKYPFMADVGRYLKDKGFPLTQFGTDPDLKPSVEKAFHRLKVSTEGGIYKSELIDGQASKPNVLELEVFSFLLAIVLIKLTGMNTLIKRFSLAEARRAEQHLEKDLGKASEKSKIDLAIRIIYDLFGIEVTKQNDYFEIPVADYLKHSISFHEREWKLINRIVENGKVLLTHEKTVRLIRKELGMENLKILHLNDAKGEIGCNLDRHYHIGLGSIGEEGMAAVIKLITKKKIPIVLETPIDDTRDDFENVRIVKELA